MNLRKFHGIVQIFFTCDFIKGQKTDFSLIEINIFVDIDIVFIVKCFYGLSITKLVVKEVIIT